jgi:hypothetical protein
LQTHKNITPTPNEKTIKVKGRPVSVQNSGINKSSRPALRFDKTPTLRYLPFITYKCFNFEINPYQYCYEIHKDFELVGLMT